MSVVVDGDDDVVVVASVILISVEFVKLNAEVVDRLSVTDVNLIVDIVDKNVSVVLKCSVMTSDSFLITVCSRISEMS